MNHVFGPVQSRRLGSSLGLDIIPYKVCSFDCVYCECGPTTLRTTERKAWVSASALLDELAAFFASNPPKLDYITFSGSGEPTLNSELGKMIRGIRSLTSVPVAVLTNSSLMHLPEVRADLSEADLVVPSLDAATDRTFRLVDRPFPEMNPESIIEAIASFRSTYKGKLWLEILFVEGINTSDEEIAALKQAVERIRPDKLQVNTVDRPPIFEWVKPVSRERLHALAERLGYPQAEEVSAREPLQSRQGRTHGASVESEQAVLELLKREGPLGASEIAERLNAPLNAVERSLHGLMLRRLVRCTDLGGRKVYEPDLR
jgi:wyosine [tRNA(Phe)-imidazoG37] synthetase (radical SAM superfamily)